MAVAIRTHITPSPSSVTVPATITLVQVLYSDMPMDSVTSKLQLADGHDIWFKLSDGTPAKTVTFADTIHDVDTPTSHVVELVRSVGTQMATVGIDQRITSSDGSQRPDHCTLVIL